MPAWLALAAAAAFLDRLAEWFIGRAVLRAEVLALAGSGEVHPPEPTVYPFERAAEALAALQSRRVTGKVVLRP